ncbi:MAG TPA: family 78 glycoside hydrolase catalytic domain [Acidimicrobiia bacterium]|nr:family 78 glycoside hydrolase catalytic domain [Acidimicrobiia bacterium]
MPAPANGRVEWRAAMISPVDDLAGAPRLRHAFTLDGGHGAVQSASLHVSSLGVFNAYVNGTPVSDDVLSPGWTSYEWRLRYRTYDVTRLLEERSVLAVVLGNGWYRGRLGWDGGGARYGDRLGVIAQLEIDFADGHSQLVVSDSTWTAGPSEVVANDLYDGQTIDARRYDDAWMLTGPPPAGWVAVEVIDFDPARLTPYIGPPVRRQESLRPVAIWESPSGRTLVDFGQNLVGWIRASVRGERGREITIRHAEVLEDGELGTGPLRSAAATDRFVLSGGDDVFEPAMTFHGFRYAEVGGWPGSLPAGALEAVVVHSDLRRIGHFECSDALVNQLHRNVVWGMRGNFLDVPTDCPQRDERLGWTGDLAVFAPTAAFLYDVQSFLSDWLVDLAAEQSASDGRVPFVIPDVIKFFTVGGLPQVDTAIWGDAAVWVPWALWQAYGDRAVLEAQYESMAARVRHAASLTSSSGLWNQGFQFGDWLDPDAPPEQAWNAKAHPGVVATACLARSAHIVAETARLLGHSADAAEFAALDDRTRAAFRQHYVDDDGLIKSDAPTVYSLAIAFGLLESDLQQRAGDRLAMLVAANGYRISTGFAGTPYICDALTMTGHVDVAYRLLLQRDCPSWLYPVLMGATTIWERWDSMLPDGTINTDGMTSFNHYALGAVADWIHRTVGGIAPLEPGYARVLVAPQPGGGITSAATSLETPHGLVSVEWRIDDGEISVTTTLPGGVTGLLARPGRESVELGPGTSTHP